MSELGYRMKEDLNIIGKLFIANDYKEISSVIDKGYFSEPILEQRYYTEADNFVFRMDVTGMSYSEVLELSAEACRKEDAPQFLLGTKIILSKLSANQRMVYFDRDRIAILVGEELRISIEEQRKLYGEKNAIGFPGMSLEAYRKGSLRSSYDKYPTLNQEALDKEYKSAVNQGNIYHHIVETDHVINREDQKKNQALWMHLIKLLTAFYATEKSPWSMDLTLSLLETYKGLKSSYEGETFNDILFAPISTILKIAFKRIGANHYGTANIEREGVATFLAEVITTTGDQRYTPFLEAVSEVNF